MAQFHSSSSESGELKTIFSSFAENGILIMLGSCSFFAIFDSLTKYLAGSFTLGEIAFVRFGFGALAMFPPLYYQRLWPDKRDYSFLILRGLLGAGVFYLVILAFRVSTLSVTMVLFYTSPVWALFMGAYFLGEGLTWKRIGGVAAAVIGITVLINPWEGNITLGHLYGLLAGVMAGGNSVLTRYLRTRHDSRVIYAFQCFVGTLSSIPLVINNVHIPELAAGTMLLILAAFGLLAQVTMNYGYRFIRAAEGATLMMSEAVFAALAGIIIFQEPLTLRFLAGASMIIGSGIYLGMYTDKRGNCCSR